MTIAELQVRVTLELHGLSLWTAIKLRIAGPEMRARIMGVQATIAETVHGK